ncbi:MAG TPA: hypothetical protein VMP01_26995 [Pirellulaceae bacterium]|nr:hypothetical protein [Pirellulaceae bacterium]
MDGSNGNWQGGAAGETLTVVEPLSELAVTKSEPFVGRWNRLVSTTNWEKGRIIHQWREALVAEGAAQAEYSDDAWAQLVGGVSGQHVGRLRRVYQQFSAAKEKFPGLFWSHFQAALDWTDAEMWLEGAVQSGWSVARMRQQRWETLGRVESERPRDADVVAEEPEGDIVLPKEVSGTYAEVQGPRHEGPDFGDDGGAAGPSRSIAPSEPGSDREYSPPPIELVQPFAALPELPDDLADAFESFKLALLRHKTDNWQQVSLSDVLQVLESLKALVLAPSSDAAPF